MPRELPVILFTEEHVLRASVHTHGNRLLEVLSDPNTDFLQVSDVQVLRRQSGERASSFRDAVIRKASVALAIPADAAHEAPQKRCDHYVSKKLFRAFLLVLGYEVRGRIALKGTNETLTAFCRELGSFFPVPHGSVAFAATRGAAEEWPVVIVNKNLVSLFELGELERLDDNATESGQELVRS